MLLLELCTEVVVDVSRCAAPDADPRDVRIALCKQLHLLASSRPPHVDRLQRWTDAPELSACGAELRAIRVERLVAPRSRVTRATAPHAPPRHTRHRATRATRATAPPRHTRHRARIPARAVGR